MIQQRRQENIFFTALALAMGLLVFAGFAQTFFLSFWLGPEPALRSEPVMYVHGAVASAWMLLLILQPALIGGGRVSLHRKLGALGVLLAIAVVILGILAGLEAAARPPDFPLRPKNLQFLGVILFGIVMFGVLVGFAVALRHDGAWHKRLMLLATVNLLQPAVVRLDLGVPAVFGPATTFLLADLFILPLLAWDMRALKRIHPATLWGGLAILLSLPLRTWLSGTETWLGFADRAVDLLR